MCENLIKELTDGEGSGLIGLSIKGTLTRGVICIL